MEAERDHGGSGVCAPYAEHPALFAQFVAIGQMAVERICDEHREIPPRCLVGGHIGGMPRFVAPALPSIRNETAHRRFPRSGMPTAALFSGRFGAWEKRMARDHGPQIKDDGLYEALREQGESNEKAARIANARAAGTLDHKGTKLEDRGRRELYDEARKIGIDGRSKMDKAELAKAIRDH
ncbi:MAG: hypothetical protein ABW173_03570 [Sphingomonas sp.]